MVRSTDRKEREKRVEKKSPEFFRGVGLFFVGGVLTVDGNCTKELTAETNLSHMNNSSFDAEFEQIP